MNAERTVFWSDEAMERVDAIKAFIREQWTENEVVAFLELLRGFEELVKRFPNGYERSRKYPGCRRAVIHAHVSVVYRCTDDQIEVVTVYDNRSAKSQ